MTPTTRGTPTEPTATLAALETRAAAQPWDGAWRRLRRGRAAERIGAACVRFTCVVIGLAAGTLALDMSADLGRVERAAVLCIVMGLMAWAWRRTVWPALRRREVDAEVALTLAAARRDGRDDELVAAVQFADPRRRQYGSTALREAVVGQAARSTAALDHAWAALRRRLAGIAVVAAALLLATGLFIAARPGHALAFVKRFALLEARYPTRTVIRAIESPGERAAYGQPIHFTVRVDGDRPAAGRVELHASSIDSRSELALTPDPADPSRYVAVLPRAFEDVTYRIRLGDASSAARRVAVVTQPIVEVRFVVVEPAYVRRDAAEQGRAEADLSPHDAASRPMPEGSRLTAIVTADKPLASATMTINGGAHPLRREGDRFVLEPEGTPLADVRTTMRYELTATDVDGLSLTEPIVGVLAVEPDRPPRVVAAAESRFVLPDASPRIAYRVTDDHALASVVLTRQVIRAPELADAADDDNHSVEAAPASPDPPPSPADRFTLIERTEGRADLAGVIELPLESLNLSKGDRVVVTVHALDDRGAAPGQTTASDPLTFLVTDRAGVLAATRRLDEKIADQLEQLLESPTEMEVSP